MAKTCEECERRPASVRGVVLPASYPDREVSRDGKVFVSGCKKCRTSAKDATEEVTRITGWTPRWSYDRYDSLDRNQRDAPLSTIYAKPFFCVTLAEAEGLMETGRAPGAKPVQRAKGRRVPLAEECEVCGAALGVSHSGMFCPNCGAR